jgi:glycosyltransferase involved in cell wall biosynthesis
MITVCEGIAKEYQHVFGVSASEIITNAPAWHPELEPSVLMPNRIRMVHHGGVSPDRRLDLMIELLKQLDQRFSLDFFLVSSNPDYLTVLKRQAAGEPRIRFCAPVAISDIVNVLQPYDLGLYLLPPTNFNNRMALPNKFFEFIQARLGVAIGPSPEMARLVREYDCGLVAEDFSVAALKQGLEKLTPEKIMYYKQQSQHAAGELCAERNGERLQTLIANLLID